MGKLSPVPLLDTRRILVALGGVIAAVAGALAGMGTPEIDLPSGGADIPGGAIAERPLLPGVLSGRAPSPREVPGGKNRPGERASQGIRENMAVRRLRGIRGWIVGPTGPLEAVPVSLVPFPRAGEPRRAGIRILSQAGGAFSFENVDTGEGQGALLVHAPGFGIRAFAWDAPALQRPLKVELSYGLWVTGRVHSPEGKPVGLGLVWIGLPLEGARRGEILWRRGGRTSREGRFVARDLPADRPAFLLVDHPLFAPGRPVRVFPSGGASPPPLSLSLVEGRKLEGQVLSRDGKPRARLFLFWEGEEPGGLLLRRGARTDGKGNFRLQGLPWNPPPTHLWAAAPRGGFRRLDLGRLPSGPGGKVLVRLPW